MLRWRLALPVAASLAMTPASAQTATTIVADGAASGLSTGTAVSSAGHVTTIAGGMLAGTNLFHSFATFDLAAGDTARWASPIADPAGVTAVINRVTGGTISTIDGRIDMTGLPNAAFFFINPAGIVLGKGARVDVPGAAHFATAETLRFADGTRFAVTTPGGSTLSIAPPSQFGFLGGQGAITVRTGPHTLGTGGLDLAARDITFAGSGFNTPWLRATAVGGSAQVSGLTGAPGDAVRGRIALRGSTIGVGFEGVQLAGGVISLANSTLGMRTADRMPSGGITLLGQRIAITGSTVMATTSGSAASGAIHIDAQGFSLDNASLVTRSLKGASGAVGEIRVTAARLNVTDNALVSTSTTDSGKAGDITLSAQHLLIDAATLRASSDCTRGQCVDLGPGGTITLAAPDLVIDDNALISASAFGDADAGAIAISGRRVFIGNGSTVRSNTARGGHAGQIAIDAAALTLNGATIVSETGGTGDAGTIAVKVSGPAEMRDSIIASTALRRSAANAGAVSFKAGAATLYASQISSDVLAGSQGNAGPVSVDAAALRLDGGSLLGSTTLGAGSGGALTVNVGGTLELYTESAISADARGAGAGGDVAIAARRLIVDNALVSADSYGAGRAGAVAVDAARLVIVNAGNISSDARGRGDGGSVAVKAGKMVVDGAFVSADSYAGGAGGRIAVTAEDLRLGGQGKIRSASYGRGSAGSISVGAGRLVLDGNSSINSDSLSGGAAGEVRVEAANLRLAGDSYITSDGVSEGGGGAVTVKATRLALVTGGFIAAETYQDGVSGAVDVSAETLLLDNGHIATQARPGSSGNAGTIHVQAETITARNDGFIASGTFGPGKGGGLVITANRIAVLGTSFFGTDSNGAGKAGTIHVTAGRLDLLGGGTISSNAFAGGDGGDINVTAGQLVLRRGVIATGADRAASGSGGNILVHAGRLSLMRGVISSGNEGRGSAGSIGIDAASFSLDGGAVSSFAAKRARDAGAITLRIERGLSLSNGAAITASSANARTSGRIDIAAAQVAASGIGTAITTSNTFAGVPGGAKGAAGTITVRAARMAFADGAALASNSMQGPAGDIAVTMPATGIFSLVGAEAPGIVTTSSGPGTGGHITITSPLALISNGGSILAQGQLGGALLELGARYFIQSADRANRIAVDGAIRIDSNLYDVSAGTSPPSVDFLDAAKVLLGQCASARATGETSRIGWSNTGPYAPPPPRGRAGRTFGAAHFRGPDC